MTALLLLVLGAVDLQLDPRCGVDEAQLRHFLELEAVDGVQVRLDCAAEAEVEVRWKGRSARRAFEAEAREEPALSRFLALVVSETVEGLTLPASAPETEELATWELNQSLGPQLLWSDGSTFFGVGYEAGVQTPEGWGLSLLLQYGRGASSETRGQIEGHLLSGALGLSYARALGPTELRAWTGVEGGWLFGQGSPVGDIEGDSATLPFWGPLFQISSALFLDPQWAARITASGGYTASGAVLQADDTARLGLDGFYARWGLELLFRL